MTERPRLPRRNAIALTAGVAVLLGGLTVGGWELQRASNASRDRIEALEETASTRAEVMDALSAGLDVTRGQLEAEGVEPAVPPAEEIAEDTEIAQSGEQGEPGERGSRGPAPSAAQVATAVQSYCQINNCVGPSGPEPSSLQVAAAVAAYCDDRGQCRGSTGSTGSTGAVGATGADGESITGPQGPGPTGEQIAAAVASYCGSRDGCRGPAGADGEDSTVPGPRGAQGEPGPACPDGADPITWTVDAARSALIGLDPGAYLVCGGGG